MMELLNKGVKRNKILALTLVFSLVLIISLSLGYILMHADHHCAKEHCPTCERITLCVNVILHLCGEWLLLVIIGSLCVSIIWRRLPSKACTVIQTTPVFRHVRMNC